MEVFKCHLKHPLRFDYFFRYAINILTKLYPYVKVLDPYILRTARDFENYTQNTGGGRIFTTIVSLASNL